MKFATIVLISTLAQAADLANNSVVAHEWGTFTSVAGADGRSVEWAPLFGTSDLPCFVNRLIPAVTKSSLSGLVRMETPVLYFYSEHPTALSVDVKFPQGWMTEWYPQASKVSPKSPDSFNETARNGQLHWDSVLATPGENPAFPTTKGPSRYYAARATDSTPLLVGTQAEKLIFYRGIGNFPAPIQPRFIGDGKLEVRNTGSDPIPVAIFFESRDRKVGYRIVRNVQGAVTLDSPDLTGDLAQLRKDLTGVLVDAGLYRKEALAMIETWHDSWFEEGSRVFYIMPRGAVDSVLPLTIAPAPGQTARVFVGRVEVLSQATRESIAAAISGHDVPALAKFGRFLIPFVNQMGLRLPNNVPTPAGGACVE
jgi:hypothetical protein